MPPTQNRALVRTAKSLLILIALLVGVECVLRFALGLGNPVLIVADPDCAYMLKPNQNIFRFFVHTRTNQFGMRSDEFPKVRDPHSLRVMFVGDSITYGTSRVDQKDIFPEILHRDLPGIVHKPVEVLNASAGEWAIDNEVGYVRSRGVFQSDIVFLVLNSGDLVQPRATFAEARIVASDKPERTAIGELYDRIIKRPSFGAHQSANPGRAAFNQQETIARNLTDLEAMSTLVSAQHAHFVIVYIPFREDIPNTSRVSSDILLQWTTAHHVTFLDLTGVESPYSASEITLDNGTHLNQQGHEIVAQGIEQAWPGVISPR